MSGKVEFIGPYLMLVQITTYNFTIKLSGKRLFKVAEGRNEAIKYFFYHVPRNSDLKAISILIQFEKASRNRYFLVKMFRIFQSSNIEQLNNVSSV